MFATVARSARIIAAQSKNGVVLDSNVSCIRASNACGFLHKQNNCTCGISGGMQCRFHSTSKKDDHKHLDPKTMSEKIDAFLADELKKDELRLQGTDPELADVLKKNKAWVQFMNEKDPDFFPSMARGQKPKYLYVGCSDARVDPTQLMGVKYGDLFVHRNVGNVVSGTDMNFLAVLEFSVDVLKVPHIVVCGHYDCGAVRGSIAQPKEGGLGLIENWIRNIRDVARLHKDELLSIKDMEQRQRRLVELNVMEQCFNIFKSACVQRSRLRTFMEKTSEFALPRVHGCVFDVADGILKKLPLNFKQELSELRQIYELYQVPDWVRKEGSTEGHWHGKKEEKS